ncbi:RNA polymerase sigma factor [Streptomyces mirabilis]|uniref:RNA polymerase sigma factor n=1 Tax=Streptomyces TaxID=1883 RepID=UPI000BB12F9A|nr:MULTISPECIES: sigma-70 family RNA polymerase sigma factor [unclassified Streptomyces]
MTAVQLPPGEDCGRPPPEGFETFFMHYEPRLRRYLYTLGARDSLLEDAAQMTLEEAFRSWPSLQDHPRQDAWLFKVARQRYAKAYKEHLKLGDLTDPVLFDRLHQDDATAGCDRRLDLLAMLRRLPEQQCEAVVLRRFFDLSYDAIAEAMGVRPSSARSLVSRALARLAQMQDEDKEEGGCT